MKRAVFFDMDGTLVDSIPKHYFKDRDVLKEIGFDLTEEYFNNECNGKRVEVFYKEICDKMGVSEQTYNDLLQKAKEGADKLYDNMDLFPHAKELLFKLHEEGITLAIVSNSWHEQIVRVVNHNKLPINILIGKDDVENAKPHPEPFLKAAQLANVDPHECIVVGDSIHDIESGHAANMSCISILTTMKKEQVPNYATAVYHHDDLLNIIEHIK